MNRLPAHAQILPHDDLVTSEATTIGGRFATAPNAFHAVRLLLALEVIAWHGAALRGAHVPARFAHFASDLGVDGFFALSGFLIVASWQRRPHLGAFLTARARRLLPGLWACLAVTAFLIVPVAALAGGYSLPQLGDQVAYVFSNAGIRIVRWDISGTATHLAAPFWNGSQWTLIWEVYCYLGVAALGVLGLLRRRVVLATTVGLWVFATLLDLSGIPVEYGPKLLWVPQRSFLMFGIGALLWLYSDRVRLDWRLAAVAAASIPAGVLLTDNYRVLAAPGLAYLVIWAGLQLGRWPALVLRHDLSYGVYIYGFPLQQALLLAGWSSGWLSFTTVSVLTVLPVAAASWFLVERPAQRLGRRRRQVPQTAPVLTGAAA